MNGYWKTVMVHGHNKRVLVIHGHFLCPSCGQKVAA